MSETIYNLRTDVSDNGQVVLITDQTILAGKGLGMPWQKADELARSLTRQARRAEEYEKANRIIADNALMQRAGANVGLSDRPDIKTETIKEALYNKALRRALSWRNPNVAEGLGNIRRRGVVGAPALTKHNAK